MITHTTDLERAQAAEIERLRAALNKIASWHEGPVVTGAFDEPHSAMTARAALGAQPAQPAEPVATSYADYQQRIGAPLTFFTSVAAQAYRAAATRDDVTHEDAMRVALQAVQGAAPPAPVPLTDKCATLMRFYRVDTADELIVAQARHIEKLQEKLPHEAVFSTTRVREG